ncbi:uncharacterized protein LOC116234786 [Phasianus colchicus]|uniref:uncharacterized protein LOC116234786 n=1 Tax=Phasianus colchicus TaxID=9054 RepID=UPI00129EE354|nr:uncharacterized protein LOC116234786 [Phasianus colchicus]
MSPRSKVVIRNSSPRGRSRGHNAAPAGQETRLVAPVHSFFRRRKRRCRKRSSAGSLDGRPKTPPDRKIISRNRSLPLSERICLRDPWQTDPGCGGIPRSEPFWSRGTALRGKRSGAIRGRRGALAGPPRFLGAGAGSPPARFRSVPPLLSSSPSAATGSSLPPELFSGRLASAVPGVGSDAEDREMEAFSDSAGRAGGPGGAHRSRRNSRRRAAQPPPFFRDPAESERDPGAASDPGRVSRALRPLPLAAAEPVFPPSFVCVTSDASSRFYRGDAAGRLSKPVRCFGRRVAFCRKGDRRLGGREAAAERRENGERRGKKARVVGKGPEDGRHRRGVQKGRGGRLARLRGTAFSRRRPRARGSEGISKEQRSTGLVCSRCLRLGFAESCAWRRRGGALLGRWHLCRLHPRALLRCLFGSVPLGGDEYCLGVVRFVLQGLVFHSCFFFP